MKIRILVVDDSTLTQNILRRIVENAGMEVIATAFNGQEALVRLTEHTVDIILLDMEMPVMNGLEFLSAMKRTPYKPPIIVVSALTQRHAPITIESLLLGASDYICKPSAVGGPGLIGMGEELVQKIHQILLKRNKPLSAVTQTVAKSKTKKPPPPGTKIAIVVAVSTGGPKALEILLEGLPAEFKHPILIVQHMPPIFTKMLADSLNQRTALSVKEASGGESLADGGIWIAPGNKHMSVYSKDGNHFIELSDGPKENFCRPAADVLFRTVAKTYQHNTIGIILTGMGQDGLLGSIAIRRRGGQILVQDEASSVVWGMPKAIVKAGQADEIVKIEKLGSKLLSMLHIEPK